MTTTTRKDPIRNFTTNPACRLQDPTTGDYLHLSGKGTVIGDAYSWIGFVYQAKELKRQAIARGEPWPYKTVGAELIRHKGRTMDHDELEAVA